MIKKKWKIWAGTLCMTFVLALGLGIGAGFRTANAADADFSESANLITLPATDTKIYDQHTTWGTKPFLQCAGGVLTTQVPAGADLLYYLSNNYFSITSPISGAKRVPLISGEQADLSDLHLYYAYDFKVTSAYLNDYAWGFGLGKDADGQQIGMSLGVANGTLRLVYNYGTSSSSGGFLKYTVVPAGTGVENYQPVAYELDRAAKLELYLHQNTVTVLLDGKTVLENYRLPDRLETYDYAVKTSRSGMTLSNPVLKIAERTALLRPAEFEAYNNNVAELVDGDRIYDTYKLNGGSLACENNALKLDTYTGDAIFEIPSALSGLGVFAGADGKTISFSDTAVYYAFRVEYLSVQRAWYEVGLAVGYDAYGQRNILTATGTNGTYGLKFTNGPGLDSDKFYYQMGRGVPGFSASRPAPGDGDSSLIEYILVNRELNMYVDNVQVAKIPVDPLAAPVFGLFLSQCTVRISDLQMKILADTDLSAMAHDNGLAAERAASGSAESKVMADGRRYFDRESASGGSVLTEGGQLVFTDVAAGSSVTGNEQVPASAWNVEYQLGRIHAEGSLELALTDGEGDILSVGHRVSGGTLTVVLSGNGRELASLRFADYFDSNLYTIRTAVFGDKVLLFVSDGKTVKTAQAVFDGGGGSGTLTLRSEASCVQAERYYILLQNAGSVRPVEFRTDGGRTSAEHYLASVGSPARFAPAAYKTSDVFVNWTAGEREIGYYTGILAEDLTGEVLVLQSNWQTANLVLALRREAASFTADTPSLVQDMPGGERPFDLTEGNFGHIYREGLGGIVWAGAGEKVSSSASVSLEGYRLIYLLGNLSGRSEVRFESETPLAVRSEILSGKLRLSVHNGGRELSALEIPDYTSLKIYRITLDVFRDTDLVVRLSVTDGGTDRLLETRAVNTGTSFLPQFVNDSAGTEFIVLQNAGQSVRVTYVNGARRTEEYYLPGDLIEEKAAEVGEGKVFGGWFTDEACTVRYPFDRPLAGSAAFSLYARAIEMPDYAGYDLELDNQVIRLHQFFPMSLNTVEAWFRLPETLTHENVLFSDCNPFISYPTQLSVKPDGSLYWNWNMQEVQWYVRDIDLRTGAWTHVAVVRDEAADEFRCYVNAQLVASVRGAGTDMDYITGSPYGADPFNFGSDGRELDFFEGQIAEIRFWSEAQTLDQLRDYLVADLKGDEPGLLCAWDFTEYTMDPESADKTGELCMGVIPGVGSSGTDAFLTKQYVELDLEVKGDYSFLLIPDTQFLSCDYVLGGDYTAYLDATYSWIRENAARFNMQCVIHLGDMTQLDKPDEWKLMADYFDTLDGIVNYALVPGNHDYENLDTSNKDGTVNFNAAFDYDKIAGWDSFGGAFQEGRLDNVYQLFNVGVAKYMVMTLEYNPRPEVLAWACAAVEKYSDYNVIINTHGYMSGEKKGGQRIIPNVWEKLGKLYPNIVMINCGHLDSSEIYCRKSAGDNGNEVVEMLADFQDYRYGGDGAVVLLQFAEDGSRCFVNTYTPYYDKFYKMDNQFEISLNVVSPRQVKTVKDFNDGTEKQVDEGEVLTLDLAQYFSFTDARDSFETARVEATAGRVEGTTYTLQVSGLGRTEERIRVSLYDGTSVELVLKLNVNSKSEILAGSYNGGRPKELAADAELVVDLRSYFALDNSQGGSAAFEDLAFSCTAGRVENGMFRYTPQTPGEETVTVTARLADGKEATLAIRLSVLAPDRVTASSGYLEREIEEGKEFVLDLRTVFDVTGSSSFADLVFETTMGEVTDGVLRLTPGETGTLGVTVTASLAEGGSARLELALDVKKAEDGSGNGGEVPPESKGGWVWIVVGCVSGGALLALGTVWFLKRRRKE